MLHTGAVLSTELLEVVYREVQVTTALCSFPAPQAPAGPDEVGKVSDIDGGITSWGCGSHFLHISLSCGAFISKEEVQGPR